MLHQSIKNEHGLPVPGEEALAHHHRVKTHLIKKIQSSKEGHIPFYDFMADTLYAPGLGYYQVGTEKFGEQGDFITAPVLSPLFGYCIGNQCAEVFKQLESPMILEFGAGTGALAGNILSQLEKLHQLPTHYYILEPSPTLQQQQQQYLQEHVPHLWQRVQWIHELPTSGCEGVIIANEVLDAMAVHRFQINDHHHEEWCVTVDDEGEFQWLLNSASEELNQAIDGIQQQLSHPMASGYTSEYNPMVTGWINSLNDCLSKGMVLLIDYGFPREEYYHPQRSTGTLMCHYRHYAHGDPFLWVGLQDITSHVDFTAVAESAINQDLSVAGFTHQGGFLLGCGIDRLLESNTQDKHYLAMAQQVKRLTLPHEMGELFKVMALTRGIHGPLMGFRLFDQRHRL